MQGKNIIAIRRERLRQIVESRYKGVQANMVRDTGINAGELSGLMRNKDFGEKKARSLERLLDMPNLWFDGTDAGQDALAREFSTVYANASDRDRSILRATLEAIKGSTIAALRPITEKPAKQD